MRRRPQMAARDGAESSGQALLSHVDERSRRSCWRWFNHGLGERQGLQHPDDKRDFGFVPARSLLGIAPFTIGFLALMEWYPSTRFFAGGSLWTDPAAVVTLTLVPAGYMLLSPLFGMKGPDPGWNGQPPRINYSLSHLIDSRLWTCLMSAAWVYPYTLLWATEYRAEWLLGEQPGGLIACIVRRGLLSHGGWLQAVRRVSLLFSHVGFTGFLAISDSTNWPLHVISVNTFAGTLAVHLSGVAAASASAGGAVTAQLLILLSGLGGFIAFSVLNQHAWMPCLRRGAGYWYWFAEVWSLVCALWFTPARLLLDGSGLG